MTAKLHLNKKILVIPLMLATAACTQNISPYAYDSRDVGAVNHVEKGTIESYRWVEINGRNKGVGTTAGAGIGGAIGSTWGKRTDDAQNIVGAIGGAILGGIIGNSIEKSGTKGSGYEYMVRTEAGELITLVQKDDVPLEKNLPVVIIYGSRARIIPDESRLNITHVRETEE